MIMSTKMSILVCSCKTKKVKSKCIYQGKEVFLCKKCQEELKAKIEG